MPTNKPELDVRRLAGLLLVGSLRIVAVLVALWASLDTFYVFLFRFDSTDEFNMVKQADVELGGRFALALVLGFVPGWINNPRQCLFVLGVAAMVWLFVSWNLLAHHEWIHRVRTGM